MIISTNNDEIAKFDNFAYQWWDTNGVFRTLHTINPIRLAIIKQIVPSLQALKILDVGCGGGILSEALAQEGAIVTGIDLAQQSIEVAKLHLYESNLNIDYQCCDLTSMVNTNANAFNVVTCMEMLEHVNNPNDVIEQCYQLTAPGGYAFFSTLNRNLLSFLLGIIASEYILKLLPKGTHHYEKCIKPSELYNMCTKHGFMVSLLKGISYNPFNHSASISDSVAINYIIACNK